MIIIADQMKDAMDDDSIEFLLEFGSILYRVFADAVDTDKKITRQLIILAIIEGDDVSEIIMLEILLVYIENIIVRAEDDGDVSYTADLALCYKSKPTVIERLTFKDKVCVFKII